MNLNTAAFSPRNEFQPKVMSVFSGMEAASVAAQPLGWEFVAFSEVDPAACWLLHAHYQCGAPEHMPRPEAADTTKAAKERLAKIKSISGLPAATKPYPRNLGDMTQVPWEDWSGQVDIMVGGPPCQAFSFAGLRGSLNDARGNLTLSYVKAIHATRPLWVLTENVPGWLNTPDNAFGCFLGALVGADAPLDPPPSGRWGCAGIVDGPLYRVAWRVLDAQGFVPQRRRRVFVVAARSDAGGNPVSVLFETEAETLRHLGKRADTGPLFPVAESMCRDPAQSNGTRQEIDANDGSVFEGRSRAGGPKSEFDDQKTKEDQNIIPLTATTLRARDAKGSPDSDCTQTLILVHDEKWSEQPKSISSDASDNGLEPIAFTSKDYGGDAGYIAPTLRAGPHNESHANSGVHVGVCIPHNIGELEADATETGPGFWRPGPTSIRVSSAPSQPQTIVKQVGMQVRRLMPEENLLLQGFPKDYFDNVSVGNKPLADGPKFRLTGNSWCVDVVRWIFERMDAQIREQLRQKEGIDL